MPTARPCVRAHVRAAYFPAPSVFRASERTAQCYPLTFLLHSVPFPLVLFPSPSCCVSLFLDSVPFPTATLNHGLHCCHDHSPARFLHGAGGPPAVPRGQQDTAYVEENHELGFDAFPTLAPNPPSLPCSHAPRKSDELRRTRSSWSLSSVTSQVHANAGMPRPSPHSHSGYSALCSSTPPTSQALRSRATTSLVRRPTR